MKLKFTIIIFILSTLLVACAGSVYADDYIIDPKESQIAFRIRHAVGFNSGFITNFSGEIDIRRDKLRSFELKASMKSVTTFNEARDAVIKSKDFFNIEEYPEAEIESRKIQPGVVTAYVTIKDIRQEVPFCYNYLGKSKNNDGDTIVVITLQATLAKKDFDLEYSSLTQAGNENIGETLDLLMTLVALEK